ncbi:penicillin binding protein PBP4B [Xylocopilactobacillus apicola]|uniref:Beta-lactamase-related domain-containing protein n=1 Tax=Xylocopilactobacillus apicola TaxID=2932184 RepID=A0AAU9DB93_9LACO|nr:penicillin binding protein PBP4B [Xylocopilactobacillus apicola]BDR59681.1 hypothetical protein XA3_21220 [Xylocopilactobacillus apicola]
MKKRVKKSFVISALGLMMLGGIYQGAQAVDAASAQEGEGPEGQFQVDQIFPIEEKDDNPEFDTWALLDNAIRKFYGFQGQGEIWLYSNNPNKFNIFINGQRLNLRTMAAGKWVKISISDLTKDGNNSLQVGAKETLTAQDTIKVKLPYPTLVNKASETRNLSNDTFKLMDDLINQEIKYGFSSAQLVVVHNGAIVKESSYGILNSYSETGDRLNAGTRVNKDTLYDLASNTKMYATNFILQQLVSQKRLDLNKKVSEIFPQFQDGPSDQITGKSDLTVRDILMHQAGFPADPQYHNNNYDPKNPSVNKKDANPVYTQKREDVLAKIIATPLDYQPGTKTIYSDVDYMLLGLIIEKVTGQTEDKYAEEQIYKPLGLMHTIYNPLMKGFGQDKIAATELNGNTRGNTIDFDNIRRHTLQGQVHDEKAFYTMKGVSGHAGLFSNASDLAVLTQTIINRGGYANHRLFDEDTLDEFIKPKSTNSSFGLGWRRQASGTYAWAFSPQADASTIGHTGWTGTLTVIDPKTNTAAILLTNERNTPIIDPKKNPNDFVGGHYLIAKYGDVASLAFSGINGDSTESNNQKLLSLTLERYHQIQKNKADQAMADKNDLKAIYETMKLRQSSSELIRQFMASSEGQTLSKYLSN